MEKWLVACGLAHSSWEVAGLQRQEYAKWMPMKNGSRKHSALGPLGAWASVGLRFAENLSWLTRNKEIRSAPVGIHVAHEYARRLPFNLKFYFIRRI